jgi:hypothetical protein
VRWATLTAMAYLTFSKANCSRLATRIAKQGSDF